jgi:hypothetical protein
MIADMVLQKKIHSTILYETWEVLKQEEFVRKPLIAHIFKYNLGAQFPMKPEDLSFFCQKILEYNKNIKANHVNLRALPCYNSQVFSQRIPGGAVTYLLFERPEAGFRLDNVCGPFSSKERVCRYMIKDFAKGWLESVLYSKKSKEHFDVNFVLAQDGIYFGTLPNVKKLNETSDPGLKNFLANQKEDKNATDINEIYRHFVTLAYPKAHAPEDLPKKEDEKLKIPKKNENLNPNTNSTSNATLTLEHTKEKEFMVQFGSFIIRMYKGLDNTTNNPPPSPDDPFDPLEVSYENTTDVFLQLNLKRDGNYSTFRPDEYLGVPQNYVSAVNAFLAKTLTTPKAQLEMENMLKDSFYEFVFKSVSFDLKSIKQFDKIEDMLKHKFITSKVDVNRLRSDTSFEK